MSHILGKYFLNIIVSDYNYNNIKTQTINLSYEY